MISFGRIGFCWALLLGTAAAAPLEGVVLPQAALQADGTRVHTLRIWALDGDAPVAIAAVRAARGQVVGAPEPASDGGVTVHYRAPRVTAPLADTLTVTARGQTLSLPLALEPAGRAKLTIAVTPDPLLLGKGASAQVTITVRDATGRPARAPLRVGASVGRLTPFEERAPGEYRATYLAPDEKYPQVAILAALSIADGAFAAAPLRLAARVTVPGEGEPGGSMQITVDGKQFGPEKIGQDGKFAIPIVVPPGGRAVGLSIDALGNQQKRELDLHLPPFPRLVVAAVPAELPADGRSRSEVVAFAVDARGAPERVKAPPLAADRGSLSAPSPRGDGAWSWSYTAPAGTLEPATLRAGSASATIALRAAPPFQLSYEPPAEPLGAGNDTPQPIEIRVRDAGGMAVTGATLSAQLAGGRVIGVEERGAGAYAVKVVPPRDPGRGAATLHVELAGLTPGAPRRVTLHQARAPAGHVSAEAWLDDDLGLPVPDVAVELNAPDGVHRRITDRYGTARIDFEPPPGRRVHVTAQPAALPGLSAALDLVRLADGLHAVSSQAGQGALDAPDPPPAASLDAEVPLKPAAPIDLRVSVDPPQLKPGQSARVRVKLAAGKTGDAPLLYQASAGRMDLVAPIHDGAVELRFTAPADAKPGARYLISITDPVTRVTVFTEVGVR